MAGIFDRDSVRSLIGSKYVLIFGGSNLRALYKDLLTVFSSNRLISETDLRRKIGETVIEYFFITKCLCPDVTNTLNEVRTGERRTPDVIVMNSTLWDIARWGSQSVQLFKGNMKKLVEEFENCLPPSTLVIWLTAPPLSQAHRGVLIEQVEFLKHTLRFDAMEANIFAHRLITSHGFDVLDFHYYLKLSIHRRRNDGVHWQPAAVRFMTNLLLTHISFAWGKALPKSDCPPGAELANLLEDIEKPLPATDDDVPVASESPKPNCIPTIITRTDRDKSNSPAKSFRGTRGKVLSSIRGERGGYRGSATARRPPDCADVTNQRWKPSGSSERWNLSKYNGPKYDKHGNSYSIPSRVSSGKNYCNNFRGQSRGRANWRSQSERWTYRSRPDLRRPHWRN